MKRGLLGLLIAALVVLPPLGEPYVLHVAIVVLIHVVYAQALYVIMRMGYLSFGHAGYIALGGYTSALLATKLAISPWIGFVAGGLVAGALRVGAGRRHPQAARHLLQPVRVRVRGGGQRRLPRVRVLRRPRRHRGGAAARACSARGSTRICSSTTSCSPSRWSRCSSSTGCSGRASGSRCSPLRTRATEALAESIGINAARYKTLAFVASCFFCGVMGAVHVHYLRFVSPFVFTFFLSTDLMVYVMVGGLGSYWGPMLGTVLLTGLGEQLFAAGYYKSLVYAVVLLVVILALPGGLISLPRLFRRGGRGARRAAAEAAAARER